MGKIFENRTIPPRLFFVVYICGIALQENRGAPRRAISQYVKTGAQNNKADPILSNLIIYRYEL